MCVLQKLFSIHTAVCNIFKIRRDRMSGQTHRALRAAAMAGRTARQDLCRSSGELNANVRRIVPAMKRMMPAASLEIVADAIELEALSEELDVAMAKAIGAKANKLSAGTYGAAYRKVDRRADRERQIDLIGNLGESLDRLVHRPFMGTTLSVTRVPARLLGLGEIHDFLERGYKAFTRMGNAREFLDLVVGRERKLVDALFAGDDSLLRK
ncbi:FFLEELY motif protein, partial [Rhodoblastus sp.]|uniref:FFLEELY motif protein n=1 Tax=Rhodoblastus sp. TaxID=1962975 RepID=UPI003F967625